MKPAITCTLTTDLFSSQRWDSPYLNHFIQPDTIIPDPYNPQNLNRYSYVLNNPLKYTDPTGHGQCQTYEDCVDMGTTPMGTGGSTGGGGGDDDDSTGGSGGGGQPLPSPLPDPDNDPILCDALANGYDCVDSSLTSYETLELIGNLAGGSIIEFAAGGIIGIAGVVVGTAGGFFDNPLLIGAGAVLAVAGLALGVDAAATGFLATEIWLGMNPDQENGETQIALIYDDGFPDVVEYGGNYQPGSSYIFGTVILDNFLEDH